MIRNGQGWDLLGAACELSFVLSCVGSDLSFGARVRALLFPTPFTTRNYVSRVKYGTDVHSEMHPL